MRRIFILLLTFSLITPAHCLACMWDYDTLEMERQRFPYAQELITGHFLRHSDAYYEWRIVDRSKKSPDERTSAEYDDLAVAYDKLGQHEKAIETIEEKIDRWPEERRYESEANLGTFLIHAGRQEEGLPHINRAIEMNPDAHFGREVYQKLLVEYVIQKRAAGVALPLNQDYGPGPIGFAAFLVKQQNIKQADQDEEIQKATKGILGMMRFGNYRSPILLEALGDLLVAVYWQHDSKLLAARAYLKASYEVASEPAKTLYRERAKQILDLQVARDLNQLEAELQQEIEQANQFFGQIEADEIAWAAAGKNLDREYGVKYYNQPILDVSNAKYPQDPEKKITMILVIVAASFVLALIAAIVVIWKWGWKSPQSNNE
ncbi:MAG: hypothetical protein KDA77_06195 [Planctomycetaceae bacterium]|nr:hypothetical protein [Planctomycetaceae bacterium]